jgi:hypothetical protein
MKILTLRKYRKLVKSCGRPTETQVENFIKFVCQAHSWYKHLPTVPPGKLFYFYLDPNAGRELRVDAAGNRRLRDRLDSDDSKFHYTWMTTADYRSKFGCLAYAVNAGTSFMTGESKGEWAVHRHDNAIVYDRKLRPRYIPDEVVEAAAVELTGVIHDEMSVGHKARRWVEILSEHSDTWPVESGGEAAARDLLNVCKEIVSELESLTLPKSISEASLNSAESRKWYEFSRSCDRRLAEALKPERDRQKNQMRGAIRTMLDMLG